MPVELDAKTANEVILGITAMTMFVIFCVLLAGQSEKWGSAIAAMFIGFAFLQVMFNASPFTKFLNAHPILTGQVTVSGQSK